MYGSVAPLEQGPCDGQRLICGFLSALDYILGMGQYRRTNPLDTVADPFWAQNESDDGRRNDESDDGRRNVIAIRNGREWTELQGLSLEAH